MIYVFSLYLGVLFEIRMNFFHNKKENKQSVSAWEIHKIAIEKTHINLLCRKMTGSGLYPFFITFLQE